MSLHSWVLEGIHVLASMVSGNALVVSESKKCPSVSESKKCPWIIKMPRQLSVDVKYATTSVGQE